MPKAIIIGASSGIGHALAKVLSQKGYTVGLTARRFKLLEDLKKQLPNPSFIREMDVTQTDDARNILLKLIKDLGGLDLIIINAGIGYSELDLNWEKDKEVITTNVLGFVAMAHVAFDFFKRQKFGHIVGISSIAALRGNGGSPAYAASKAFESNYLEGLRLKARKMRRTIIVTDVKPGFVDTAMARDDKKFWVATPEKAAEQIYRAIHRKKRHVYVSRRWQLFAWLMRILPDGLMAKGT